MGGGIYEGSSTQMVCNVPQRHQRGRLRGRLRCTESDAGRSLLKLARRGALLLLPVAVEPITRGCALPRHQ